MSQAEKQLAEFRDKYAVLEKQYSQLLEKNQNDLITIRQKEKNMDTLIANLQGEKQSIRAKMQHNIDILSLQIQKLKINSSKNLDQTTFQQQEIKSRQKQSSELEKVIHLKQTRIDQLQISARRLIDENIQLSADKASYKVDYDDLLRKAQKYEDQIDTLKKRLGQLEGQLSTFRSVKTKSETAQTSNPYIDPSQLRDIQEKLKESQNANTALKKQIEKLEQSLTAAEQKTSTMKERLKETNQQLKRIVERDKKTGFLLRKKDQELLKAHEQIDKMKKHPKNEKRKMETEESVVCMKCRQWEQENKLLKQMVKSVQTMVRVRQIEAQKYKHKQAETLNNLSTKGNSSQVKKSNDRFPPIGKKSP